jgi:CBS domain-containing protein
MKAKDVMTSPIVSVEPGATVLHAIQIMLRRNISGLPVVDKNGDLVGIVTEGDFLRRIETGTQQHRARWLEFLVGPGQLAAEYTHSHGRKVEDVMTRELFTASEESPIEQVVDLMDSRRIKRVPVVRGKNVVGIISRANLLHALASISAEAKPGTEADENIRSLLLAELANQQWAHMSLMYVNPIVRHGTVELWGTITDERERQALTVAAENVPGVTAVRDHLVLISPISGMVLSNHEDQPGAQKE